MNKNKNYIKSIRLILIYVIFISIFLFLSSGLFYRQIVQHTYFQQKEKYQNQRRILIPAPRGDILDRNGKIIVCNKPIFDLHIYFNDIRHEVSSEAIEIAKKNINKLKYSELQNQARKNIIRKYLTLANEITGRSEILNIKKLERHYKESIILPFTILSNLSTEEYIKLIDKLPVSSPLYISTDYFRFYPYHSSACHLLGYVTSTNEIGRELKDLRSFLDTRKIGKTGIELSQNETLSGIDGEEIFAVDPSGFRAECVKRIPPKKGKNCKLSIDIDLQIAIENEINPYFGSAVVMDVNSGEILAIASSPSYDTNLLSPKINSDVFKKITKNEAWINRAMQACYPPGPPFKIISSIAFLRNGTSNFDNHDTIECTGKTKIKYHIFRCNSQLYHDFVSLESAIKKNCDIYYCMKSQICGIENISSEAKNFNLDRPTGIELPFETKRMVIPDPHWKKENNRGEWLPIDTANTAVGKGYLLVSPLQMACFISSLAKNRTTTVPHIFSSKKNKQDNSKTIGLSSCNYKNLINSLQIAKNNNLEYNFARHSVAGQTGLSKIWDHGKSGNIDWFVGFSSIENPNIAIAVAIHKKYSDDIISKETDYTDNTSALSVASKILDFYFKSKN